MPEYLLQAVREVRMAVARSDPAHHSGEACKDYAAELARAEKVFAAARARYAARAAECGAHRREGHADAADWMASLLGSSVSEAKRDLDTAKSLGDCPDTEDALRNGEISLDQAKEIADAEDEVPGSERELLPLAKNRSLSRVRDAARKKRLDNKDPDELLRRQHEARTCRTWTDRLGMTCGRFALPPDAGVRLVNRLNTECDRLRREAKGDGRAEPRERHAADALANLVCGTATTKAKGTDLVIVCDLNAWRRGHAEGDEPCHLVGGGPIPVWLARQLRGDAFLKAVLHDGVAIHTVKHFGRRYKAELLTALNLGDPPGFEGVRCCEPGCDRKYHLEKDHVDPVANHGPTAKDNIAWRCWPHHRAKTERDRREGKLAGTRGPP